MILSPNPTLSHTRFLTNHSLVGAMNNAGTMPSVGHPAGRRRTLCLTNVLNLRWTSSLVCFPHIRQTHVHEHQRIRICNKIYNIYSRAVLRGVIACSGIVSTGHNNNMNTFDVSANNTEGEYEYCPVLVPSIIRWVIGAQWNACLNDIYLNPASNTHATNSKTNQCKYLLIHSTASVQYPTPPSEDDIQIDRWMDWVAFHYIWIVLWDGDDCLEMSINDLSEWSAHTVPVSTVVPFIFVINFHNFIVYLNDDDDVPDRVLN